MVSRKKEVDMRRTKNYRKRLGHAKRGLWCGYGSMLLFLLIGLALLFPTAHKEAEALDIEIAETEEKVAGRAVGTIAVSLDSSSIDTGSEVSTATGKFSYATTPISVTTNNKTGYNLYLAPSNGKNTLTNQTDTKVTTAVTSITTDTLGTNMAGNTWGYILGTASQNAEFKPVPTSSANAIYSTTSAATSGQTDTIYLGFGAHILDTLPVGKYSNTMVVSAVANYVPPSIDTISTMQEMTPEICQTMELEKQYQLKDSRDQKTYYVARLRDGNCWMTQNLAYDFVEGTVLTSEDSDVTRNWTVPNDPSSFGYPGISSKSNTVAYMWKASSAGSGHTSYGNHYNWMAATAGTGQGLRLTNASGSICPKGWRLPTARSKDYDGSVGDDGEFPNLIRVGGLTAGTVQQSPYWFQPAGNVYFSSGPPSVPSYGGSIGGAYWSSTAGVINGDEQNAFYLFFGKDSDSNLATGTTNRYNGATIRCIAK